MVTVLTLGTESRLAELPPKPPLQPDRPATTTKAPAMFRRVDRDAIRGRRPRLMTAPPIGEVSLDEALHQAAHCLTKS